MTDKTKDTLMAGALKVGLGILGLSLVALIVLEIYCWVVYGNLPPEDVPSWVHWLMWRR